MTDLNEAVYTTFGRIYGALISSRSAEEQLALIRREVYATWAVMFPESAETPVADEVSA